MNIKIEWEFDLPEYSSTELHDNFAKDNGVPLEVDLKDYFEEPENIDTFQITDALSDEHGWLVKNWSVI